MENNTFENVKQLRIELNNIFTEIEIKLKSLNEMYEFLVKTHQDKNYIMGMDSFYFQNKLILMECDHMKQLFCFINNRIYCEYYKLYKMLFDFINKEIKERTLVDKLLINYKKYPIYKDLEPTKIYDFNTSLEINHAIINIIKELKKFLMQKQEELKQKKKHSDMGINIQSIVHEQTYDNSILEKRINMFENYLNTFYSHHSKYFSRLTIKLKLMMSVVNEDFHLKQNTTFENNCSINSEGLSLSKPLMNDKEEEIVVNLTGNAVSNKEVETELNIMKL